MILGTPTSQNVKMNSKWISCLNANAKTTKLLENKGGNLRDLGSQQWFSRYDTKSGKEKINWTSEVITFCA